MLHEFPEHYGEVLSVILRGSEGQNLSLDVWRDLLGALSGRPKAAPPIQASKIREEIRRYATEQRLLSRQEVCLLKDSVYHLLIIMILITLNNYFTDA